MIKKLYWFLFIRDLHASLDKPSGDTGTPLKMKLMQELSYAVLFSYLLYIFSPGLPVVADLIAHTFWEQEHLKTAHHDHGSNHVGLEVVKVETQSGKENTANNQKNGLETFSHTIAISVQMDYPPERMVDPEYSLFICTTSTTWQEIDYPPPRI